MRLGKMNYVIGMVDDRKEIFEQKEEIDLKSKSGFSYFRRGTVSAKPPRSKVKLLSRSSVGFSATSPRSKVKQLSCSCW
jgi:hypothetical protein